MKRWLELRTAYEVARHGKVAHAADALGVHRATVNRHIDTLEAEIGTKLFLRHSRGYTLTDAGEEFLKVAQRADELFAGFVGRSNAAKGKLSGEIILTAPAVVIGVLMKPIVQFRNEHPKARISLIVDDKYAKLEYGEAHVALRGGTKPQNPEYIAQPFDGVRLGVYAHVDYIARMGQPNDPSDFPSHHFADSPDYFKPPAIRRWFLEHVPDKCITLKSSRPEAILRAVTAGAAIGLLPAYEAQSNPNLVEIVAPKNGWNGPMWLVTHIDLHRTEKVQAMLKCIKESAP